MAKTNELETYIESNTNYVNLENKQSEITLDNTSISSVSSAPIDPTLSRHPTWSGASVPLRLDAHVRTISQIDSVSQTFRCKLHCYVYRGLTPNEQILYDSLEDKNEFMPQMYINFEPQYSVDLIRFERVKWNNNKEFVVGHLTLMNCISVVYMFIVDCVFLENFELTNFPFDVQHFEMQLEFHTEQQNDELGLFPFNINLESSGVALAKNAAISSVGWEFIGLEYGINQFNFDKNSGGIPGKVATRIMTEHNGLTTENVIDSYNEYLLNQSKSKKPRNMAILFTGMYSQFIVRLKFQRSWRFFFTRVVVVLSILSFLSLFCFTFGVNSTADRFGFVSTILLAAVAYQFIIQQYIPALNYLTLLDKYIYFTFGFLLILGVQNGLLAMLEKYINYLDNDNRSNRLDDYLLAINAIIWFTSHGYFYILSKRGYEEECLKISQIKEQIEDDKTNEVILDTENEDGNENENQSYGGNGNADIYSMGLYFGHDYNKNLNNNNDLTNYHPTIRRYVVQENDTHIKRVIINNQQIPSTKNKSQ